MMHYILASQSPRRQELLHQMGLEFTVQPADVDETLPPELSPEQAVAQLSRRKAEAISCQPDDCVIAADTIVVCGQILGKPQDEADAVRMLKLLSGRTHQVMTAVTVRCGNREDTQVSITDVTFRTLETGEAERYTATGEPMDKAGAYGIQGGGALFVERIAGDYYGVMGLPVCMLHTMLRKLERPSTKEKRKGGLL